MTSKIIFEYIKWKNFLSYGNYETKINLNTSDIVVISGANGSGKTTIMEALFFALTGEANGDILKNRLVNNINKKNCQVELGFKCNNKDYIIKRGINPNYFLIYENEKLLPEDGKRITYYQDKLEAITGLTPSIIRNTILINSSLKSYFKLSKGEKRTFNDEIFNLTVFNIMLSKLKLKFDEISSIITNKNQEIMIDEKTLKHQIEQLKQYDDIVSVITKRLNEDKEKYEKLKFDYINNLKSLVIKESNINEKIKKINIKNKEIENNISEINNLKLQLQQNLDLLEKEKELNNLCPTCGQKLPKEKLNELKLIQKEKINNLNLKIKEIKSKLLKIKNINLIPVFEETNELKDIEKKIYSIKQLIIETDKHLKSFTMELPEKPNIDLELTKNKISENKKNIIKQNELIKYLKIVNKILLDGEIKAYIINNYLPFINEQFNYYLENFNFNLKVKFNSDFEWKILAPKQYIGYGYDNFSAGEKMRINLALLFTFIQLNKLINFGSLNLVSNILCIDEFIDSNMDTAGISDCINLITEKNKKENLSIFIISHRLDSDNTDFNIIRAVKEHYFSKIKE